MEEINIKDFLNYLKNYIVAFAVLIFVAVLGVVVFDVKFKTPLFEAKTTVVIAKSDALEGTATSLNDINASQKLVTTYGEIAKSELVLNKVIENLGLNITAKDLSKKLTIKPVNDTSILSISAKDAKPQVSAETPETSANNTLLRDVALATVIAVLLVAGFAFLRFYLDDTVKHNDDVEKAFGLPRAGRISRYDVKFKKGDNELIVSSLPKAIVSENIKSLRTNLQFTAVDKDLKTILVTSTNAGEGKSFVSSNLAISFAQADKKVLLVDCDLRKGRVNKLFGVLNTDGLSNLLAANLQSFKKHIRSTKIENLDIMTSGTYPPNPSELLASKKNKKLIQMLSSHYDIVILDGAPVGGLADSVILSSLVDETLIVVKDGATARADLTAAKDSIDKVGGKIAGIVFNMVDRKSSKYYDYYYSNDNESKRIRR